MILYLGRMWTNPLGIQKHKHPVSDKILDLTLNLFVFSHSHETKSWQEAENRLLNGGRQFPVIHGG